MNWLPKAVASRERGAALIIVLAFVVLLTGVAIAYLSRTTSDRQVAHSSFNQSSVDGLAQSAMDTIIGDLRQEIVNGSTATTVSGVTIYTPTSAANMVPQRSGNAAGAPNLIRRSWSGDTNLSVRSRASAVNSRTDVSANGRYITSTRWNGHYLVPKGNTATDDSSPIPAFTAATPDWVFVTGSGAARINQPSAAVLGRYAYAVYDEGGLLDMNVAGYPTGTSAIQSGRKGSIAFADLKALGSYPIPNPSSGSPQIYQIDQLVGWRNYGTISPTPSNNFPDITPAAQAFAKNFQTDSAPATAFFNFVANNTNGFLTTSAVVNASGRTDQMFTSRQELIAFKKIAQFATSFNVFSPSTPAGSTIDYAALARTSTAVNPNFLLRRVTNVPNGYTRFDGTTPVAGEPLVKTRFPLSRLAWITYKGPSALLATSDPVYQALINAGVGPATISTGTAANITRCFGLQFGGAAGNPSFPWVYTNPTGTVAAPASRILRLDEVAAVGREADFFELLGAGILSGSLGQNTSGGVTGGNVFPDVHMSNTTHHILSIGAAIIDQADPDSIPTRIQFSPSGTVWTAYGVENLPYITQLYPIAGTSPDTPTRWATYLLFQLWNPHQSPADVANKVRLRIDGGIGIFAGGNGQAWNTANTVNVYPPVGQVTSVTITKSASFPTPAPLATDYTSVTSTAQGTFAFLPTPAVPTPTP